MVKLDDVIKWKHFPRYWPFVREIHQSPVNSPNKRQWRGALVLTLISARTNDWTNNRDAGDLRRHHAHYDVTGMKLTVRVIFHLGTTDGLCFWHYQLWYDWLTPLVWFLSPLSPILLSLNKHSWGWWLRRCRAHYDVIVVIYFNYHIWIPDVCRTGT